MTAVRLDGADLAASLAAAQADLLAQPAGTAAEWEVPAGAHALPVLALGRDDCALTLVAPDGAALTVTGAGAALEVRGTRVVVRGLDVRVEGDDDAGFRVLAGTDADVSGCTVSARGRSVIALDVAAGGTAQVLETTATDVDASTGDGTGVRIGASVVRVHRVSVGGVTARGTAAGLLVTAASPAEVTGSRVRVGAVVGASATGVEITAGVVGEADPEGSGDSTDAATLLDADVDDVRARAVDGEARAVVLRTGGPAVVRGASATQVRGATAFGLDVLAGAGALVSGATVGSVAGGTGGAAGLRLRAGASPAEIVVDDVHVESVFAPDHPDLVRGVEVAAVVSELAPWLDDDTDAGAVRVTACVLRRVSGTALVLDADLRDVEVRGVETSTAARAASVRGERVTISETTWHRLGTGLDLGPCALTLVDSLITGVAAGPALVRGDETEVVRTAAAFSDVLDPDLLLTPLPGGVLPYVEPGPAGVPAPLLQGRFVPEAVLDLRLVPASELSELAVGTPGDPPRLPRHVGAQPPAAPATCDLRDPLAVTDPPAPAPWAPGPVIDRTSKDGRGLLAAMRARAAVAVPGWVPTDVADLTTTLLELVAHRLDRISYRQDAALTEAYLLHARRRRSVEEHARLVDYRPDPGLSATTMLEVTLPPGTEEDPSPLVPGPTPFVLGAGSLVVNPDATQDPVVVSTEQDLTCFASLAAVRLLEDVPAGATSALLDGDLLDLERGRWLVLAPDDPRAAAHVVRATLVEVGTDETLVRWDPRRPAPRAYEAASTVVRGNVVPAHHGLMLPFDGPEDLTDPDLLDQLAALGPALDLEVAAVADAPVEVSLPVSSASRVAAGWPFPGEPPRTGVADVRVEVEGEPWSPVDDVATTPGEVFALATDVSGGTAVVLGQPGTLPDRPVQVRLAARLGGGTAGNVGAHTLTSLVALGPGSGPLPVGLTMERLRTLVLVDNPVPGIEGRDPEPLDRIRRRAPWAARTPVTAVTTADHARRLEALPEVAAARARLVELGERRLVRVTLLLAGEDTLVPVDLVDGTPPADVDRVRDAERLRRWTLARRELERVRLLGFDVQLVPPTFVPVDVDVVVDALAWAAADRVHRDVVSALEGDGGLFDPDTLGLGGDVHVDSVLRRVLGVDGVGAAHVRRLRRAVAGAVEHAVDGTLPIGDEEVAVLRRPYGDGQQGLLTVEVCGGVR